jgi:hypothetical protein
LDAHWDASYVFSERACEGLHFENSPNFPGIVRCRASGNRCSTAWQTAPWRDQRRLHRRGAWIGGEGRRCRPVTLKFPKTRKVIDSNFLQTEELRIFLNNSAHHFAVLTEFAALEAYKGDTLRSLPLSMSVLVDYPRQVIVLKGAELTSPLVDAVSNAQLRLIDREQTAGFPAYCRALKMADSHSIARAELVNLGKQADARMMQMVAAATKIADALPPLLSVYSDADRRALVTGGSKTPRALVDKLSGQLLQLVALGLVDIGVKNAPPFDAVLDTLIFRQTLCVYIWALRTIRGVIPSNPDRIRNDMIDAAYAAYATFFDGLLSKDKLANEIYDVAVAWLSLLKL